MDMVSCFLVLTTYTRSAALVIVFLPKRLSQRLRIITALPRMSTPNRGDLLGNQFGRAVIPRHGRLPMRETTKNQQIPMAMEVRYDLH